MNNNEYKAIGTTLSCGTFIKEFSHRDGKKLFFKCVCSCGKDFISDNSHIPKMKIGCKSCCSNNRALKMKKDLVGTEWETGTKVISFDRYENKNFYWNVYCGVCKKIYIDNSKRLLYRTFAMSCKDCCNKKIDLTGYKFGKGCVVLHEDPNNTGPKYYWFYQCHCGKKKRSSTWSILYETQQCRKCAGKENGLNHRGPNNHYWNPKLTDEQRIKNRDTNEDFVWRKAIMKKYNHTCIITGSKVSLHVHHIYNYNDRPELRYEINNGVPLRSDLHIKFHQTYGYKNNDVHQLNEFILNN